MRQVRVAVAMGISFLSPMFGIPFESALAQDSPVLVRTVGSGAGGSEVWYVHAPSCVTTLVGETGTSGLGSLAKTGAGVLYSVNYENTLVTVDPATGQTATVAALTGLGTLSVRARTFDALGRLLAIAKNPADNSDGFGDPVKPDLQTLAFAPDGTLYGIGHGNVYAIDLATGNATIECAQVTQGGGAGSEYILSDWVPPPSLEFVTQPSDTRVGELISPAVAVRLTNAEGEPIPGVAVRLDFGVNPSGATLPEDLAISTTDASGVAVYDFLRVDLTGVGYTLVAAADLPAFGTVTGLSAPFNVAGTTSRGPRAVHIFALRLPAGACHPAYPSAQCRPTGDLLPTGPPEPDGDFWLYSFGVFDTGSEIVFNNNSNPDGMSDADVLDLCGPGQVECGTNDPNLPAALEARIWGL
ncbi:MAG: hypothetical protein PVG79_10760, partial [Gemmatimonadales bacterium]